MSTSPLSYVALQLTFVVRTLEACRVHDAIKMCDWIMSSCSCAGRSATMDYIL